MYENIIRSITIHTPGFFITSATPYFFSSTATATLFSASASLASFLLLSIKIIASTIKIAQIAAANSITYLKPAALPAEKSAKATESVPLAAAVWSAVASAYPPFAAATFRATPMRATITSDVTN